MSDDLGVTPEERKAIASLRRLAKRWPSSLTLMSMSGTLNVVRTADPQLDAFYASDRTKAVIASILGIPNDGGDW